MSQKIQLSIPKPCHEDWDKMSPDAQGRFCGSCQKQVVDFSNMSDREVAQFFKKPSTGSVCGRFMDDQLGRELEIPKKRVPFAKYFFQVAIPMALMSQKAIAQGSVKVTPQTTVNAIEKCTKSIGKLMVNQAQPERPTNRIVGDTMIVAPPPPVVVTMGMIARPIPKIEQVIVHGKVVSEAGVPLAGVTVNVSNGKGTSTAKDGSFEVKIIPNQKMDLEFTTILYKAQRLTVTDTRNLILVKMEPAISFMAGEIVVAKVTARPLNCIVMNEEGEPIPYATVVTDKNIIMAGEEGDFNLPPVKDSMKLSVSSVGYNERVVTISKKDINQSSVRIVLVKKQMQNVVVTGYSGSRQGMVVTGTISKIPKCELVLKNRLTQAIDTVKNFFSSAMKAKVYPNPVHSGGSITIQIEKADEGMYQYELMGTGGQVIERRQLWIDAEARVLQMEIPVVAPGTYIISLYNKKAGKRISEKIVVQ